MLLHYKNQACPELAKLFREDPITWSVLLKILQEPCRDILTDHQNVIVCYSEPPYPVWIWCRDAENSEAVMDIACCLKERLPLETIRACILPEAVVEKLMKADPYFRDVKPGMGLLSYRLHRILPLTHSCEGYMRLVEASEIPGLLDVWGEMHMEMEGVDKGREHNLKTITRMVNARTLFAWRTDAGIVALTARADQREYGKITSVYTLPKHRRRGYAISLVHRVTETILDDGLIPILYTDAAYGASNDCYRKIGYEQVDSLVSICK